MKERRDKNKDIEINSDLEIDDIELEETELNEKDKLKKLQRKLKKCEEEKRTHLEELQRVKADFLNSKRRLEEQLVRDKERAADKILIDLLTLVDSFDTAMVDTERWKAIDETWRSGVEAIHAKLHSILNQNNLTVIDPVNEQFNPVEHEAVGNQEVDNDKQVDTVLQVLQKGFKRNGVILRPARVIVGTK